MGLIKDIIDSWKRKIETTNPQDFIINWSVVQKGVSIKEFNKRHVNFHQNFKFKLLLPILWLAQKVLNKTLIRPEQIDREPHNDIILAWNDVFLQTILEWCVVYRKFKQTPNNRFDDPSSKALETMLSIFNTGYLHDTAYRIFFDMLSANWAIRFGQLYPAKIGKHLYICKTINDLDFKAITGVNSDHFTFKLDNGDTFAVKKGDAILIKNFSEEVKNKVVPNNILRLNKRRTSRTRIPSQEPTR